jgi:hypothetical protein
MGKLVFGMSLSLDYEWVRDLTGSVYGRRVYELRYWDEDCPEWSETEHDFAAAWRRQPKWVVSRLLKVRMPPRRPSCVNRLI